MRRYRERMADVPIADLEGLDEMWQPPVPAPQPVQQQRLQLTALSEEEEEEEEEDDDEEDDLSDEEDEMVAREPVQLMQAAAAAPAKEETEVDEGFLTSLLQAAQVQHEAPASVGTPPAPAASPIAEPQQQRPSPVVAATAEEPEDAELEILLQFATLSDGSSPDADRSSARPNCEASTSPPMPIPDAAQLAVETSTEAVEGADDSDGEQMITPPPTGGELLASSVTSLASDAPEAAVVTAPVVDTAAQPSRMSTPSPAATFSSLLQWVPATRPAAAATEPETLPQQFGASVIVNPTPVEMVATAADAAAEPQPPPAATATSTGESAADTEESSSSDVSPAVEEVRSPDPTPDSISGEAAPTQSPASEVVVDEMTVEVDTVSEVTPETRPVIGTGSAPLAAQPANGADAMTGPMVTASKPKRKSRARPRKTGPAGIEEKGTKRPWTTEEDAAVLRLVGEHGPKGWSTIASQIEGRVGKQCRERWQNHLDPSVSKAPWSAEEEQELLRLHKVIGNKWVEIANHMPGRTDSSVKNQFHKLTYHRPELAGISNEMTPAECLGNKRKAAKLAMSQAGSEMPIMMESDADAEKRRKTLVGGAGDAAGLAVSMGAAGAMVGCGASPVSQEKSALDSLLMFAALDSSACV